MTVPILNLDYHKIYLKYIQNVKKSLTIPQKSNTSFATKYCKKVIENTQFQKI